MNKSLIKIYYYEILDKSTTKILYLKPGPNKVLNVNSTFLIYSRHFHRYPKFVKKHTIIS